MKIKILTLDKKVFDGFSPEVVLPGEDGEFSVLDFHAPCLYRLRLGVIQIKPKNFKKEKERRLSIREGIARIIGNELVIMCET